VNSIEKTKFYVSYSQQNLRFNNSKLFLHHKQYSTIMPVNFYLTKRFFSAWHHPDSFSRGGECSKPWLWRDPYPAIMARLHA